MGHPRIAHLSHPRQQGRIRAQDADEGLALRCGKCGKRIDTLTRDGIPTRTSRGNQGLETVELHRTDGSPAGRVDAHDEVSPGEMILAGDRGTFLVHRAAQAIFRCRARCGARYPVKLSRLRRAAERAIDAGTTEVVLGIDV